jgi:hypothetical protein
MNKAVSVVKFDILTVKPYIKSMFFSFTYRYFY